MLRRTKPKPRNPDSNHQTLKPQPSTRAPSQVLPFMLRRTKTEVLSDLPPKIIQDFMCDLSPLQQRLYNDFAAKQKAGEMVVLYLFYLYSMGGIHDIIYPITQHIYFQ